MNNNRVSLIQRAVFIIVPVIYISAVIYMFVFMASRKAPLIPYDSVQVIRQWTYTDQLTGTKEDIETPARVDTDGRNEFVYEAGLPARLPDGCVIAFLNRMNLKVEVGDRIVKEWNIAETPVIGGVSKNSYFIIPIRESDAGSHLRITFSGEGYGGKMFDAFVGNKYEVTRYLETKSGAVQFAMSFALLVCSLAIIIAGMVLSLLYKQNMKLILISLGIFAVSAWMVVDSFVFQFVFRTQFIDGFMSYITTLCIIFPFLAYLDAIQDHRYSKWYGIVSLIELVNLILFVTLHLTHVMPFSQSLLYIDAIIGVGIVAAFIITITDIRRGYSKKYRFVAYGFLIFMIMSIIEIVLINTVVERVEGGVMIAGLYILFAFAIVYQIMEIRRIAVERDTANEMGIAKTRFLASMSHEIRTPINSILGMNEMILKESRNPDIINYANIINDSGTMLLSLINDILDVSKIESDMEEIVAADYDPGRMFDNAAEMLRSQARKKDLNVKIGKPQNLPAKLCGDEKRISQILTNLLTNAVKYTEEGLITFTGECFESDRGYTLSFFVSDTGIGIKPEDIDGIFDPFHRLDLQKNQNIQGTGLGLSIVKSLIEKMNGEIKVDSVYGKGSTFSVRIPQQRCEQQPVEKYNSGVLSEEDDLNGIDENYIAPEARILEVDDNLSNQIVVREFLKATGAHVDIVSGGREALKLCKINRYDLILMDHMMPSPDGIETMHMIKSEEGSLNVSTPEIVLTANALAGSRSEYEAEGFDNYLSKPVESRKLLRMVRKYLPEEKVFYKPKPRKAAPSGKNGQEIPEGPVDIEALLARFDNKEETVRMILAEVVKEGERKIPLLRQLAADGDIKRYATEAHGIKGSMSNSCINSLSQTAKSHELAAKEGNLDFVRKNIDSFLAQYEDVLDHIKDYLKRFENEENSHN